MMIYRGPLIFFIFIKFSTYAEDTDTIQITTNSKNPLPYFRRIVEEASEDSTIESQTDDSSNFVAILVNNAKAIFEEVDDISGGTESTRGTATRSSKCSAVEQISDNSRTTNELFEFDSMNISTEDVTESTQLLLYKNLSFTTLLDRTFNEQEKMEDLVNPEDIKLKNEGENYIEAECLHLSNRMKSQEKFDIKTVNNEISTHFLMQILPIENTTNQPLKIKEITPEENDGEEIDLSYEQLLNFDNETSTRTCIFCNNINTENCDVPDNNIITTIQCNREGDLCYSQHTPFGVVDRGCYNVNFNLTTYVCSCNLCNDIAMSEMPNVYTSKQHWIDDVIELSRTRSLRKSIFKDMSCLRCEVNSTKANADNMVDAANCLEGNIGTLQIQDCEDNEICAVRAVRNDGYVWRGCVSRPLYNYWWDLCDSDLCNHDPLVSIYDYVQVKQNQLF